MLVRTDTARPSPARTYVWAAIVAVAVLLVYANSFPGAFFFDDDAALLQNPSIRDLTAWRDVLWPPVGAGIGGRPFANLTFALNYAVAEYRPAGYHAVNLAIHLAATVVLFALTRRTLLQPSLRPRFGEAANGIAAIVALLWGLHPLQANIVDYMSQRTEGLMALLYLVTLYAYVRSVDLDARPAPTVSGAVQADAAGVRMETPSTWASRAWIATAVVAAALGMVTKEGMVTAPAMVLLYDRTFVSGGFFPALRRHGWRIAAIASTWVILAALMWYSQLDARGVGLRLASPLVYAITECRAVTHYLALSLWPHSLVFDYGTEYYVRQFAAVLPSALVLFSLLAASGFAVWRWPVVGFACAWFFVLLSPSSSFIPVAQQPCAENRVYLPLAGIAALLAVGGYRAVGRVALAALGVAALALGAATFARNPVFRSEFSIWWETAAKRPGNARAQNNLGNALLKAGRPDEALARFEAALRISPNYSDALNNLGVTHLRQGRPADALPQFKRAAECKPDYADAYYNMGEAYLQLHQDAEAVTALNRAIDLNPENPKAHNNLGIALLDLGRVAESIREEQIALALNDRMPEAHYNLGNSLARAGRIDEAIEEYDTALELDPRFAKAQNNAGVLELDRGNLPEARRRFEAALQLDPRYPEARGNLGLVLRRMATQATPTETTRG